MGGESARMDGPQEWPRRVRVFRQRREGPCAVQRDAAHRSPGMIRRVVFGIVLVTTLTTPACAQERPASDSSFAALVARISETGGYFDSDNIISNESSYLQVASQLAKVGTHGGVYI